MASKKLAKAWDVVDHGIEHSQYFSGYGAAGTTYEDVATGIGDNALEAFDDALEMLAQNGWDVGGIEMPDNMGTDSVSSLRDEERAAVENRMCSECGLFSDECECINGPTMDDSEWEDDDRYYHVTVLVRRENTEERAERHYKAACSRLNLSEDTPAEIVCDALQDSGVSWEEASEVLSYKMPH